MLQGCYTYAAIGSNLNLTCLMNKYSSSMAVCWFFRHWLRCCLPLAAAVHSAGDQVDPQADQCGRCAYIAGAGPAEIGGDRDPAKPCWDQTVSFQKLVYWKDRTSFILEVWWKKIWILAFKNDLQKEDNCIKNKIDILK